MEIERSGTADTTDTGEHFFGALVREPPGSNQISAQRIADLTSQIEFLDREIVRYRELLEHQRIRFATNIADVQLASDTSLDELRRHSRSETQALHDSYRAAMTAQQVEFDQLLSNERSASAAELAELQQRQQETLERVHARNADALEANRQQTADEASESHQRVRHALESELAQATMTIQRLESELVAQVELSDRAGADAAKAAQKTAALQRQIDRIEDQHRLRLDEAEKQVAAATERLNAERRRSAATLAELLERSASIAAETDKARTQFEARLEAKQAETEQALSQAVHRAQADYRDLAAAADERAALAIARESELEDAIAQLRNQLTNRA